jgi:hypothetical protein
MTKIYVFEVYWQQQLLQTARIEAGSLHTALHRLGHKIENNTTLSYRVNGDYKLSIKLKTIREKAIGEML